DSVSGSSARGGRDDSVTSLFHPPAGSPESIARSAPAKSCLGFVTPLALFAESLSEWFQSQGCVKVAQLGRCYPRPDGEFVAQGSFFSPAACQRPEKPQR